MSGAKSQERTCSAMMLLQVPAKGHAACAPKALSIDRAGSTDAAQHLNCFGCTCSAMMLVQVPARGHATCTQKALPSTLGQQMRSGVAAGLLHVLGRYEPASYKHNV